MKKACVLLVLLLVSCSFFEDDKQSLIDKDKAELNKSLHTYNVLFYKYFKLQQKALHITDTSFSNLMPEKEKIEKVAKVFHKYNKKSNNLSALDYIKIYRDFKDVKSYVQEVDEDIFPARKEINNTEKKSFTKQEIAAFKNTEHAVFAAISLIIRDLGIDITFYEIAKIDEESIPESETKSLLRLFKSFIYLEKGLYYLSEDNLNKSIDWIENEEDTNFKSLLVIYNEQKAKQLVLCTNYLLRGIDRLLMGDEASEKKALEDFQSFISITNELGVENEITLSIETFLYLKKDESKKAIVSLNKLKQSNMLSNKDKKSIDKAISYLNNREPDKVLNSVYDKFFLGKIISIYIWNTISEVDWKKIMKENDIMYTEELYSNIETIKEFIKNIDKYTSSESLDKAGEKIKDKTKNLWSKAKELVD